MIQTISPDSIVLLSENIGIVMETNILKYSSMKTKNLPIVRLGKVNDKLYAINHYDVVLGCKQSKNNVQCTIEEFKNLSDVLVQHFCDILSSDILNTPLVYNLVDSLQEKLKTDKVTVLKILGIDKLLYCRLLMATNRISEAAISKLEELVTELSKRKGLTAIQASTPIYVLEKISRISDESQQLQLIHFIASDLRPKSDSRFFWMTPEQIDSITQMIRQNATRTEYRQDKSTVAQFISSEKLGEIKESSLHQNKKPKTSSSSKKTREILEAIPNMLVIPDEKGNPEILVDKKTGTVSKIDTSANKKIIKTCHIPSKKLYSIPLDVVNFLEMEDQIRHKNITGVDCLKAFVDSQKDATRRYTVFWNAS